MVMAGLDLVDLDCGVTTAVELGAGCFRPTGAGRWPVALCTAAI
jgi:hypothetical protein